MSIALAVVIQPSKLLQLCVTLFASLLIVIGVYVTCLPHLSIFARSVLVAFCCFAVWRGFVYNQKVAQLSWRLIVSNQGQLWCQLNSLPSNSIQTKIFLKSTAVNLLAGTTLWANVLFLRLYNAEYETTINLVVFPDALSPDEFRRLSIACKWIVTQADPSRRI